MTLRIDWLPLRDLTDANVNPHLHDLPALRDSMIQFGYVSAAAIDGRTGRIVGGHGRKDALAVMRAGGMPPDGVTVDSTGEWLVPVVVGWSSVDDDHAIAAGIALNWLRDKGGWDLPMLAETLVTVRREDTVLADLTGFTADDALRIVQQSGRTDLLAGISTDPMTASPPGFHLYLPMPSALDAQRTVIALQALGYRDVREVKH